MIFFVPASDRSHFLCLTVPGVRQVRINYEVWEYLPTLDL